MSAGATVHLQDRHSLADLATYVGRAARADPDGAARLTVVRRSGGSVLAVYVCPVHGGGGPTVLGLRTIAVDSVEVVDGSAGTAAPLDVVVPLAGLSDRLARPQQGATLAVPPVELTGVRWAGISPPRAGWQEVGTVSARALSEVAHRGITEVAAGAPDVAGAPAVAALRARVWGRTVGDGAAAVPAGAAFAAQVLGFLTRSGAGSADEDADVPVRAAGVWRRLTLPAGHVLSRPPMLTG